MGKITKIEENKKTVIHEMTNKKQGEKNIWRNCIITSYGIADVVISKNSFLLTWQQCLRKRITIRAPTHRQLVYPFKPKSHYTRSNQKLQQSAVSFCFDFF